MNIVELKKQIEEKKVTDDLLIFEITDNTFIATQYVTEIAKQKHLQIHYIEDLNGFVRSSVSVFSSTESDYFYVFHTDKLDYSNSKLKFIKNFVIICSSTSEDVKQIYSDYIVKVPKLETWQIKDYVYSLCKGITSNRLDWLIDICKNDIYRLTQEIKKLSIFNEVDRQQLFDKFIEDDIFSDLSTYTIFNFSNCFTNRDAKQLYNIYTELDNIDIEPIGLVTILIKNFKNLILVQLTNNPTPENTGLSSKQIYAIQHNCGVYSKDTLVKIYEFLTNIDKQIKIGDLPVTMLIDYITVKIFSM